MSNSCSSALACDVWEYLLINEQEFVLELAALIQARTSLFGDVAFES